MSTLIMIVASHSPCEPATSFIILNSTFVIALSPLSTLFHPFRGGQFICALVFAFPTP